jgi:hypothetical protein
MDTDLMAAVWAADDGGDGASIADIAWLLERSLDRRIEKLELLDPLNEMRSSLVDYAPPAGEDQPQGDVPFSAEGLWKLTKRGRFEVLRR